MVLAKKNKLRQRYDPTDPEGVMGLASSKRSASRKSSSSSSSTGGGFGSKGGGKGKHSDNGDAPEDTGKKEEGGEDDDDEEEEEVEVWETEEDVRMEEPGGADLGGSGRGPMSDVCIVVDSGFSFTHVLPFYQGRALHKSVGVRGVRGMGTSLFTGLCVLLFLFCVGSLLGFGGGTEGAGGGGGGGEVVCRCLCRWL